MPFRIKVSLIILALLLTLAVVLPLVLPVGPPPGVRPLSEVAGPDAQYVEVAGIDLHVRRWDSAAAEGAAPGPVRTFLLLHGFPYSTHSFDGLAPLLTQLGDVVAVDMPGFGLSERPDPDDPSLDVDPYAAASQPELVAILLEELGVDEVVLVGHGHGARVGLDTALTHPDLVSGLVTIGASPFEIRQRSWLSRLVMSTPQMRRLGPVLLRQLAGDPGKRLLWAGWYDPTAITPEQEAAHLVSDRKAADERAGPGQLSQADAPVDLEGRLGAVRAPVLVVAGEEDGVVPTDRSQRLEAELPDASLVLVPQCGHAVQEECPEELAAAVSTWLEE